MKNTKRLSGCLWSRKVDGLWTMRLLVGFLLENGGILGYLNFNELKRKRILSSLNFKIVVKFFGL